MFSKLKESLNSFKKKLTESAEPKEEKKEIKSAAKEVEKIKKERTTKKKTEAKKPAEPKEEKKEKVGFFGKIGKVEITEETFGELFSNFETELLENNVAYEVVEGIRNNLTKELMGKTFGKKELQEKIEETLREFIVNTFKQTKDIDLLAQTDKHKPLKLLFVGVNGVGKTTTLAKLGHLFQNKNKTCVFAAADTFRAAAIEQLQEHADKLKIPCIKHSYGADAAAVAFDAIKHAESKGVDVVLIDSAGRMHSNEDLMQELNKLKKVAKPHFTILVVDSLTGNDAVEQAATFNELIDIDGIMLTKADANEKGGALISSVYMTKKPILYIGVGQEYKDLEKFDVNKMINRIF